MSGIGAVLVSILPSVGLALIFWYVMRAVIRADRRERAELAKIDAEEAAKAAAASDISSENPKPAS